MTWMRRDRSPSQAPLPSKAGTILAFGENPWTDYWQTRQHLLSRLPDLGWNVGFTQGLLSRWDGRGTPGWDASSWRPRLRQSHGVTIAEPGRILLLSEFRPVDRVLLDGFVRRFLAASCQAQPDSVIAYLFSARFLPYLDALKRPKIVFHVDDNFSAMRGWTPALAEQQAQLIERADLVLATTPGVADWLGPAAAGKLMMLPNGADAAAFEAGRGAACPPDLAVIPRPRLSYVGSLNEKVDFILLDHLARGRPDWHWALIGRTWPAGRFVGEMRAAFERCVTHANVHFLGEKPFWELPAYCAHSDVNTMLYRTDGTGWWHDIYPLKLHEYLATGLPVVSTDVPAVRSFADVVAICRTPDAWPRALESALAGGIGSVAERIAVARANSWDDRATTIDERLRRLVSG